MAGEQVNLRVKQEVIETPYGEFLRVTVSDGVTEGVGTSRDARRVIAFALEDLAKKVLARE